MTVTSLVRCHRSSPREDAPSPPLSLSDLAVKAGDRIAQLVLEKIEIAEIMEVPELDETARGAGACESEVRRVRERGQRDL